MPIPEYPTKSVRVWLGVHPPIPNTHPPQYTVPPEPTRNLIFLLGCESLVTYLWEAGWINEQRRDVSESEVDQRNNNGAHVKIVYFANI